MGAIEQSKCMDGLIPGCLRLNEFAWEMELRLTGNGAFLTRMSAVHMSRVLVCEPLCLPPGREVS